jgi:hypothetical protein
MTAAPQTEVTTCSSQLGLWTVYGEGAEATGRAVRESAGGRGIVSPANRP